MERDSNTAGLGCWLAAACCATLLALAAVWPASAQTPRPIPPDIAAVGAPASVVPPAALSKRPDFRLKLYLTGRAGRTSRAREFQVAVTNIARWRATSVRVCARVSGLSARITGVKAPGSLRTKTSACWIVRSIASNKNRRFGLRLRTVLPLVKRRRAIVRVTASAGNSNRLTRVFSTASATRYGVVKRKLKPKRSATQRGPALRRAAAPSCQGGQQLGIAFVADDSGSMQDERSSRTAWPGDRGRPRPAAGRFDRGRHELRRRHGASCSRRRVVDGVDAARAEERDAGGLTSRAGRPYYEEAFAARRRSSTR